MNNHKNYLDILRRCSDSASFYQASIFMQEEESDALKKDYEKHIIYKSVFSVVNASDAFLCFMGIERGFKIWDENIIFFGSRRKNYERACRTAN